MLRSARSRAEEKGIAFTITRDDVLRVMPSDGVCPALGVALASGRGSLHDWSPTLDRINNDWGYTPDNIAVISYAANAAKRDLTAEQLERIAAWMRSKGLR